MSIYAVQNSIDKATRFVLTIVIAFLIMKEYLTKTRFPLEKDELLKKVHEYKPFNHIDVTMRLDTRGTVSMSNIIGVLNYNSEEIRIYPDYKYKNSSELIYRLFSGAFGIDENDLKEGDRSNTLYDSICKLMANYEKRIGSHLCEAPHTISNEGKKINNPYKKTIDVLKELNHLNKDLDEIPSETLEGLISKLPNIKNFKDFDNSDKDSHWDYKLITFMGSVFLCNLGFERKYPEVKGSLLAPLNKIFEYYVLNRINKTFEKEFKIMYQSKLPYIDKSPDGPIGIRPDYILTSYEGNYSIVIDAKYKYFNKSKCYNDVHQISTYIKAGKCQHGALIHPRYNGMQHNNIISHDQDEWFVFLDLDMEDDELKELHNILSSRY